MACFRTKKPEEARAFCERLRRERGFREVPAVHELRQLERKTFRVYESRGWIRVAYCEPSRFEGAPREPLPVLAPPYSVPKGSPCIARPGCTGKSKLRGACQACLSRIQYWKDPEAANESSARSRAKRAARRAAA